MKALTILALLIMKDYKMACLVQAQLMQHTAKDSLDLFCEIMGFAKNDHNNFIGDDPHGVVDFQEGYMFFNMSDIHVVIAEYDRWLKLYKNNKGIAKAVKEWYYWSLDWYEKHPRMEWQKVVIDNKHKVANSLNLPELDTDSKMAHKRYSKPVLVVDETELQNPTCCDRMPASVAMYDYDADDWWMCELGIHYHDTFHVMITHWKYIDWPDGTYCPNLRSWLAGCPVPGLREATEEYKQLKADEYVAAQERFWDAQEELEKAIEDVKNESF